MNRDLQTVFEKLSFCFETRKFADLRIILLDLEPADIAQFMENNLNDKEQLMFFRLLPKELASDVFIEIETDTQESFIKLFISGHFTPIKTQIYLQPTSLNAIWFKSIL